MPSQSEHAGDAPEGERRAEERGAHRLPVTVEVRGRGPLRETHGFHAAAIHRETRGEHAAGAYGAIGRALTLHEDRD